MEYEKGVFFKVRFTFVVLPVLIVNQFLSLLIFDVSTSNYNKYSKCVEIALHLYENRADDVCIINSSVECIYIVSCGCERI